MSTDPPNDPQPHRADAESNAEAAVRRLEATIGAEPAAGDWLEITQKRIDTFAEATSDHQFIHVDPVRAAETRFGGTIAHGFLTLGMVAPLTASVPGDVSGMDGLEMEINYGLNKVRFIQPVPVGARIRATTSTNKVVLDGDTVNLVRRISVEIEGDTRPALVADWITQAVFA